MAKPLSYEALLAVLAVAAAGCAKSESVTAAPEATATAARVEPAASAAPPPATAPVAVVDTPPAADVAVDAGVEKVNRPRAPAPAKKGAMAACGAGQCSPDMKKK